jgi:hypothetical protein
MTEMVPSPMCGEAGLQTTALADLAARAEADGIIPVAEFCVNVRMLNFAPFNCSNGNPQSFHCQDQAEGGLSKQFVRGEASSFVYVKDDFGRIYLTL